MSFCCLGAAVNSTLSIATACIARLLLPSHCHCLTVQHLTPSLIAPRCLHLNPVAEMVTPLVKHDQMKKRTKAFTRHFSDRLQRLNKGTWRKPKGQCRSNNKQNMQQQPISILVEQQRQLGQTYHVTSKQFNKSLSHSNQVRKQQSANRCRQLCCVDHRESILLPAIHCSQLQPTDASNQDMCC